MFDLGFNNAVIMSDCFDWQPFIGSLAIQDGRIAYIGERKLYAEDCLELRVLDQKLIMPGLVNGHCHGDMTLARGLGDGLTLAEQNERFASHNWFEHYLSEEDRIISRRLTYAEAMLSGCTFILENMYWSLGERAIEAVQLSGIRAALAEDYRPDFRVASTAHESHNLLAFARACRDADIIPVLGSVSEEDFDSATLRLVRKLAHEADMLITCHLAETKWREELTLERYGMTPVTYLAEQGFLGPDLIASHVVYTSSRERRMLADSDTKVINTPLCEYKIADGLAAVPDMLEAGITVGLGTDGALWNNNIDLFREMKGLLLANSLARGPRSLDPKQALRMATADGAAAFGRRDIGDLRLGNLADFIILDWSKPKFKPTRLGAFQNVASSLAYNASGEDVRSVYIGGVEHVREGRLCKVDQDSLIREADARGQALFDQL